MQPGGDEKKSRKPKPVKILKVNVAENSNKNTE